MCAPMGLCKCCNLLHYVGLLLIDLQISQAYANLIATQNNLLLQILAGPFCLFLMNTSGLSQCVFVFLYIFFVISNFSQNKKLVKHLFLQIICNKATDKT